MLHQKTPLRRLTPLRARKPMARGKPMRRRPTPRNPISPEDRARLDWLHTLPCCAPIPHNCGPIEVHHDTQDRARGKKTGHASGMPVCHAAHMDFHATAGPFKGWKRDDLRAWQTAMVTRYQALWLLKTGPAAR